MKKKELLLAAKLLDESADIYSNNGCNDWEFPKTWSQEERRAFMREYHEWNGDLDEFDPSLPIKYAPDFAVMRFLAHKLKEEAREEDNQHEHEG